MARIMEFKTNKTELRSYLYVCECQKRNQ